jgi:hypothetical protein
MLFCFFKKKIELNHLIYNPNFVYGHIEIIFSLIENKLRVPRWYKIKKIVYNSRDNTGGDVKVWVYFPCTCI